MSNVKSPKSKVTETSQGRLLRRHRGIKAGRVRKVFDFRLSTFDAFFRSTAILGLFVFLSPLSAQACAVCFGNKDSLQTKGTMAGVLFLLIVIVVVLAGFAVTFVRWGLRERALQESLGPASSEPGHS